MLPIVGDHLGEECGLPGCGRAGRALQENVAAESAGHGRARICSRSTTRPRRRSSRCRDIHNVDGAGAEPRLRHHPHQAARSRKPRTHRADEQLDALMVQRLKSHDAAAQAAMDAQLEAISATLAGAARQHEHRARGWGGAGYAGTARPGRTESATDHAGRADSAAAADAVTRIHLTEDNPHTHTRRK